MKLKQIACTELHEHPDHDGIFRDDVTEAIAAEVNNEFLKHHALIVQPESDLVKRMEATGLFYARFIDNWVVLATTRWKLRKAIPVVKETLAELKVQTWDFQDQGRTIDAMDQVVRLYELAIGVDRQLLKKSAFRVRHVVGRPGAGCDGDTCCSDLYSAESSATVNG